MLKTASHADQVVRARLTPLRTPRAEEGQATLSQAFPSIASAGLQLRTLRAVLDGEIVALDAKGKPSFQERRYGRGS